MIVREMISGTRYQSRFINGIVETKTQLCDQHNGRLDLSAWTEAEEAQLLPGRRYRVTVELIEE